MVDSLAVHAAVGSNVPLWVASAVALITAIGGIAVPVIVARESQQRNEERGNVKDEERRTELQDLARELKSAIRDSHTELREDMRDLRKTVDIGLATIEADVENAQRDATAALHASVGINGANGNRGEIKRVEGELKELKKEVARLAERRLGPADVGSLSPKAAT